MRLAKALGVIVLIGLLIAGCGREPGLDGLADGGRATVASASAGDAVILSDGRRVRLAGVEAPHGNAPYADEARGVLERLVAGREVQLLHGGARADRYGRVLAQLRDPAEAAPVGAWLTLSDGRAELVAIELVERSMRYERRSTN